MNVNIRRIYLYLTSFIGLVLILIGATQFVNLGLRTWIFTKADNQYFACLTDVTVPDGKPIPAQSRADCEARQKDQRSSSRQSDAARSLAFIVVGIPVWVYHWRKVKDERSE